MKKNAAEKEEKEEEAVALEEPQQQEEEEKEEVKPTPKKATPKTKKVKAAGKDKKKPAEEPVKEEEAAVEEEPQVSDEEGKDGDAEQDIDAKTQELLAKFDSDSEDEQMPDQTVAFKKGQDVGKAPKPKKAAKAANGVSNSGQPGVMYLGSIPHGFYEHEIREYFSQFGTITKLRVVRSKKTGASKHRPFVEFEDAEVADIAARTMDNYLLFGHILRAKIVPPVQVHPELFKGCNRRFKVVPWNKMAGKQLELPRSETSWKAKISKEEQRRAARAEKLKAIGYEFETPALKAAEAKPQIEGAESEAAKAIEAPPPAPELVKAVEEKEKATISQGGKKTKVGKKAKKVKA